MSPFVQVFGCRHDEAIHALRRPASEKRQGTKSREVAQMRLCGRFRTLTRKGKRPTIVVTAIARELSAFIWAINREVVGSHATANQ